MIFMENAAGPCMHIEQIEMLCNSGFRKIVGVVLCVG